MVSVAAYSGAYPTGYGINAQSCGGEPAAFQDGNYSTVDEFARYPYQYSCTGFAHFQPSGQSQRSHPLQLLRLPLYSANNLA